MSEMIERIAKVFEADDRISPFMARRLAREAVETMREPTESMLEAGTEIEGEEWAKGGDTVKLPYQAMIDAALANKDN